MGHQGREALATAGARAQAPLARAVDAGGPPRRVDAVWASAKSRLDAARTAAHGAVGLAGERGEIVGEEAGEAHSLISRSARRYEVRAWSL